MEYVTLKDGTRIRIIEYKVTRMNPNLEAKYSKTMAEAMEYLKTGLAKMHRLVERNGRIVEHAWDDEAHIWYDETGNILQESGNPTEPESLPGLRVLKVHKIHLKESTIKTIKEHFVTLRAASPALPAGKNAIFTEGLAMSTEFISKDMPDDLIKVLRFAKRNDYDTIIITEVTDVIKDLPVYAENKNKPLKPVFELESLNRAYKNENLTPANFPAKLEIWFNRQGTGSMQGTLANELLDVQSQDELESIWQTYCENHSIHPDTIVRIEKLCDL